MTLKLTEEIAASAIQGAITFKFWVQLSSRCNKILWENRLGTLSLSHVRTSKGYLKKRRLGIWTEKTIVILKTAVT